MKSKMFCSVHAPLSKLVCIGLNSWGQSCMLALEWNWKLGAHSSFVEKVWEVTMSAWIRGWLLYSLYISAFVSFANLMLCNLDYGLQRTLFMIDFFKNCVCRLNCVTGTTLSFTFCFVWNQLTHEFSPNPLHSTSASQEGCLLHFHMRYRPLCPCRRLTNGALTVIWVVLIFVCKCARAPSEKAYARFGTYTYDIHLFWLRITILCWCRYYDRENTLTCTRMLPNIQGYQRTLS